MSLVVHLILILCTDIAYGGTHLKKLKPNIEKENSVFIQPTVVTDDSDYKQSKEFKLESNGHEVIVDNEGKRNMRSTNAVTIVSQHNDLLSILMDLTNRLMRVGALQLSEPSWNVLSKIFSSFMSILFGSKTNIFWPMFTNIAAVFLRLLTL